MKKIDFDNEAHKILGELPALCPISLSELSAQSAGTVQCQGVEVPITGAAMDELDNLWGISKTQKNIILGAAGPQGMADLRNCLNQSLCKRNDVQAVVAIDKKGHTITQVRTVIGKFITPALFFNFVKMLIEATGYYLAGVHTETLGTPMIRLYFNRANPAVVKFSPSDSFIVDGIKAEWKMGKASIKHYMMRRECSNQMTSMNLLGQKELHTLNSEEYNYNLKMLNSMDAFQMPIQQFLTDIRRAAQSAVSLNELSAMKHLITMTGIDERIAEGVIPYSSCVAEYKSSGIIVDGKAAEKAIGPDTVWHFYNRLTDFASHTEYLAENDYRRAIILDGASRFLTKTPDIEQHTYHNIYNNPSNLNTLILN